VTVRARLYRQPKSAMQSGHARTREWVLEWERTEAQRADPIMGWIGSGDTQRQVRLRFDTREEAERYAASEGLTLEVELTPERVIRPKAYADNFRFGRRFNWTH
jgi:hypothetical protein